MNICIPVSAHDKHLLPAQADCLLKMGGLEEHQVIYFPTLSAKDATYETAERLGAEVRPLDRDFDGGAPVACNNHFAAVVNALGLMGNTDPFLWMEADMLPVSPRWPGKLLEDYRMGGTPFRGNVVPTPFEDGGKLVFRDNDTMMMGCGIYPAHMERDERIKPLIADLAKPAWMNPRIPFDVYLRWPIKTIGVSNTYLIADMWATQNYRVTAEGLECDSVDHGDKVVRKRGGAVPKQALLIHGCKDGSLAEIALGKGSVVVGRAGEFGCKVVKALEPQGIVEHGLGAPDGPEGADGFPSPAIVPIPSEQDGDDGFWGNDGQPVPEPETVIPVAPSRPKEHTVTKAPAKTSVTRADIEKAMGGKKMRATDLATKLKVDVAALIGTFATNGYIVAGGGWVQSTIPITKD